MIRKQIYLWELIPAADGSNLPNPANQFSIFTSGYGNEITETAMVREDHFVVIDDFGSTPGISAAPEVTLGNILQWRPNGFVQIVINTTHYYQNPENIKSWGVSGDSSPFPKDLTSNYGYLLQPAVYVRPFQTWDIRYAILNEYPTGTWALSKPAARVFVQYWLFSGSDALICEQLLSLGIEVNVDNVEWFRRQLLLSRGLDTSSWEWYLATSTQYWKEQREAHNMAPQLGLTLNNRKDQK